MTHQLEFLRSQVSEALALDQPRLSLTIIKSFNVCAIGRARPVDAGRLRTCEVFFGRWPCGRVVTKRRAPSPFLVPMMLQQFLADLESRWETDGPINLAAFTLWSLNFIHPFVDGNGRAARAACYFVLCLKAGRWLPGRAILPELIEQNRAEYVAAVRAADGAVLEGPLNLEPLQSLLRELMEEQLAEQTDQASMALAIGFTSLESISSACLVSGPMPAKI